MSYTEFLERQIYEQFGVHVWIELYDRRSDVLVAAWYDVPEIAVRTGIRAVIDSSNGAYPEHLRVVTMAFDETERYAREDDELREWLAEERTEG